MAEQAEGEQLRGAWQLALWLANEYQVTVMADAAKFMLLLVLMRYMHDKSKFKQHIMEHVD